MPVPRRWITGLILAGALFSVTAAATSSLSARRMAFCAPAAHLAGFLSGAPCVPDGADYRLIGRDLDLTVVPACAAADYFCMMAAFLSLLATWRGLGLRSQLLVIPAAWLLTILINALRLNACWQADRLAQVLLPQSLWPVTHMAVGIVTFLAGLIAVFYLVIDWTCSKGEPGSPSTVSSKDVHSSTNAARRSASTGACHVYYESGTKQESKS